MKRTTLSILIALSLGSSASGVLAETAGQILFAKGDVRIVDLQGKERPARQGEMLQAGERLLTPAGGLGQIKLLDGSLVGVRPETELKVELPQQASERARNVISLVKGAVRVINLDLRDGRARAEWSLNTPTATVQLKGADAESFVLRQDAGRPAGGDAGTYSRLLTGSALISSGSFSTPLAPRQLSYVPTINTSPVVVSALPPTLAVLDPAVTRTTLTTTPTTTLAAPTTSPTTPSTTTTLSPTLTAAASPTLTGTRLSPTTSTLTSPLATSYPTIAYSPTPTVTNPYVVSTLTTGGLLPTTNNNTNTYIFNLTSPKPAPRLTTSGGIRTFIPISGTPIILP